jgi:glucose-6-phosphate 1-dehydrogenase
MKTQKILILGITGNLSKLKILPAVGQYYDMYKDDINIELYGYSRSQADQNEIEKLLKSEIKTTDNLPKIILGQGSYEDNTFYDSLIQTLGSEDSLIVYLAVPPSVYKEFLQNSCPYPQSAIDILIEKPFGESLEEARDILKIVSDCDLHQRVHFIDHYLFKSAFQVDILKIRQELSYNLLGLNNIKSMEIKALETVDVKERGGYYDQNGAIKDMFPHLYSAYNFGLGFFGAPLLDTDSWAVNDLQIAQYEGYKDDADNTKSTTESYFKTSLTINNFKNKPILVTLESGKKQSQKLTQMLITFENNYKLEFQIAPQSYLKLTDSKDKLVMDFEITKDQKLDHVRVFEDVFAGDYSRFVPNPKILDYWELYNKIISSHIPKPI